MLMDQKGLERLLTPIDNSELEERNRRTNREEIINGISLGWLFSNITEDLGGYDHD